MKKRSLFIGLSLLLAGCLHMSQKIHYLPRQISKAGVLEELGRPFNIYRKNNKDYWVYRFRINKKLYTKSVIFKHGKMIRKGKLTRYPSPGKLLKNSENFSDFRKAVNEIKKRK